MYTLQGKKHPKIIIRKICGFVSWNITNSVYTHLHRGKELFCHLLQVQLVHKKDSSAKDIPAGLMIS